MTKRFGKPVIMKMLQNTSGISMLEILIAAAIILITIVQIIPWQISSWKRTSGYNRVVKACNVIEQQIEQFRIFIGTDPEVNYPRIKNCTDTTLWDSSVTPPIECKWHMESATDPFGDTLENVRRATIVAYWSEVDSLIVKTVIAKNF